MSEYFKEISFVGSFPDVDICPKHKFNEYAFIGRSNVGKSSLINFLCNSYSLAKTSKKPGKTQMINMFEVDKLWCMVDLPGYGYAVISKKKRLEWKKMIYSYLEKRENLVTTFVLLDSRLELQQIDLEFINWLGRKGIPFSIIYTKIDGVKRRKQEDHIKAIQDKLLEYWEELPNQFITSAVDKTGREEIMKYILSVNEGLKK